MAVTKEYSCRAHGPFESRSANPKCPRGCNAVERVFLTAPGYLGRKTKNMDLMQKDIAKTYGLSDLSNKDGRSLMANANAKRPMDARSFALPPTNDAGKENKTPLNLASVIEATGRFENANSPVPKAVQPVAMEDLQKNIPSVRQRMTLVAPPYNG